MYRAMACLTVPNWVLESKDCEDWANAIKVVRLKDREMRLDESTVISETFAKTYNWQDHCIRHVETMRNISRGKGHTLP